MLDGAQPVAVKMIRDRKDGRPQLGSQLRAFEGELAIMRNARHRNIVMCYGGFLDPVSPSASSISSCLDGRISPRANLAAQ